MSVKSTLLLLGLSVSASGLYAQTIETPADTPLSLNGDLNLPANKSIQAGGASFIKIPPSGGTNINIGVGAGASNTSGVQNLFIGYEAGQSTNSNANLFMGYRAGTKNSSGQFNTFLGVQAGQNNTSGSSNFMLGTNAGVSNTTGSGNYFLGDNAGYQNTTGGFNIYIGANAGNGTGVNGDNNTAIGFEAGRANGGGFTNTFIGFRADASANNLTNASALGSNAKVSVSNALVLGNNANVGIGTTAPGNRLHVVSASANSSGVRLQNLTSSSPATALNQTKFLTVDASGNVILGSTISSARQGAAESPWQSRGEHLQNSNTGGVIIGSGMSRTPGGYKLFVQDGILTEKVKVAVKNTGEWSDNVFESGYSLRSLPEVEQYIQQHKHLPGVPSAEEVVKEGVDVAKMDAKLLEKIEELTLYMIEMRKENQQYKIKLEAQQQQLLQQADRIQTLESKLRESGR